MITLPFTIEGFNPINPADALPVVTAIPTKKKNGRTYLSEAVFLDTETSKIAYEGGKLVVGWIYQWAFRFAGRDWVGRYPNELVQDLIKAVQPSLDAAGCAAKCIVFVHNLSYDIQYLKGWLFDVFGTEDYSILAVGPHKFITFCIGPLEFRCTWKLSNKSLDKWGKDLGIEHRKKKGLIDYSKVRYQDDPLELDDWLYMLYDVWALEECLKKQLAIHGDDLNHVPLTSTGYVRRDARKEYRKELHKNRAMFERTAMSVEVYKALKGASAGGLTHGNRIFEDYRVDADCVYKGPPRQEAVLGIGHVDYRSDYPSQIRASDSMYGFPTDRFAKLYEYKAGVRDFTWDELDKYTRKHCVLIEIMLRNVKIKAGITMPYLQYYKCHEGRFDDFGEPYYDEASGYISEGKDLEDNGRVLEFTGSTKIFCTEWDIKWIRKQYDFQYRILKVWISPRGAAPKYLQDTVDEYFIKKDVLKNKVHELEANDAPIWDLIDANISLIKSKNGLNGIFGMSMTDPVRVDITMDPETGEWTVPKLTDDLIAEKLNDYYKSYNNFMIYAIGVYVTALARNEIMEAVEAIGYKYFLYMDTDSIFFIITDETKKRLDAINEWRKVRAEAIGAYVTTPDGRRVQYDVLEYEKENITSFKYIHAKAYAYITDGGTEKEKLHCTIAGVSEYSPDYDPKEHKGTSRVEELGSIDKLHHGMTFTACGGTTCSYIEMQPTIMQINGHVTQVASAAIITESSKRISGPIAKDEVWWLWDNTEEVR